jgi:hypothetical protein
MQIALTIDRRAMLRDGRAVGATQEEVRQHRLEVMGDDRRMLPLHVKAGGCGFAA